MAEATVAASLVGVRRAAREVAGVAVRTPLLESSALAGRAGVPVRLKAEQLQPIGAFKIRGAFTAVSRLPDDQRARGVITYSSGNHGQAVAYAARHFGVRAVVVMPEQAPRVKVEAIGRLGGDVVFAGVTSAARLAEAERLALAEGLTIVPPFDAPDVIEGQGTCGLEILDQAPDVATIVVPVGGGGLLAGIALVVRALRPEVRLVGVEPTGAAKLTAAMQAGRPVRLERTASLADGLLPLQIGDMTFAIIREAVTEVVTVSDDEIAATVALLHREDDLRLEPSGAATAAAILGGHLHSPGPIVAVASGGNVDDALFERLTTS